MVRIQLKHPVVICNRLIDSALLLVGAASNVVGPCIVWAQLHQVVAVSYRIVKHAFFQVR